MTTARRRAAEPAAQHPPSGRSRGGFAAVVLAGGSLGGALSTSLIGYLVTHYSYNAVFIGMSFLHPLMFLFLAMLLPRLVQYRER